MHLDDRAIQRDCLDPDTNDLCTLQFGKYAIQHAAFGPTVHPRIDRMPPAKALGQSTPLAALLSNIKNRIYSQVRNIGDRWMLEERAHEFRVSSNLGELFVNPWLQLFALLQRT